MSLNLNSPTAFTTGLLITNTVQTVGGSSDSIPSLTKINGESVSAALEIQSSNAGLLIPRLSEDEMDKIKTPAPGMVIYNTTAGKIYFYTGGGWGPIGSIIGPSDKPTVIDNIATWGNTTGSLLLDSGININKVPPQPFYSDFISPDIDDVYLKMSNLDAISFSSHEVTFDIDNNVFGIFFRDPNILETKTIFTDSTFDPTSTSPSVLFELNSSRATFLNVRMAGGDIDNLLTEPGMQVFDTTNDEFLFYQKGTWTPLNSIVGGAPPDATYILAGKNILLDKSQSLGSLPTGLLKNTVDDTTKEGTLSTAIPVPASSGPGAATGDYYAPGFPIHIIFDGLKLDPPQDPPYENLFLTPQNTRLDFVGSFNTGVGISVFQELTGGTYNTAYGNSALQLAETASFNTAIGNSALQACATGNNNVGVGGSSLETCNSSKNTALGKGTLQYHIGIPGTDTNNTALGFGAGGAAFDGYKNCTFVGANVNSSSSVETPKIYSDCTFIGANINTKDIGAIGTFTNSTVIGANTSVKVSDSFVLGKGCNVGILTQSPTYALQIGDSLLTETDKASVIYLQGILEGQTITPPTTGALLYSKTTVSEETGDEDVLDLYCQLPGERIINLTSPTSQDLSYVVLSDENLPTEFIGQNLANLIAEGADVATILKLVSASDDGAGADGLKVSITLAIAGEDYVTPETFKASQDEQDTAIEAAEATGIAGAAVGAAGVLAAGAATALGVGALAAAGAGGLLDGVGAVLGGVGGALLGGLFGAGTGVIGGLVGSSGADKKANNAQNTANIAIDMANQLNNQTFLILNSQDGLDLPNTTNSNLTNVSGGNSGYVYFNYSSTSPSISIINSPPIPTLDKYIIQQADTDTFIVGEADSDIFFLQQGDPLNLPNAQSLGSLSNGLLKNSLVVPGTTPPTGVLENAIAGEDFYSPGFPTFLKDTSGSTNNLFVGSSREGFSNLGSDNVIFGLNVSPASVDYSRCVGVGIDILLVNEGADNIAIGYQALSLNEEAIQNIAIGTQSQANNLHGNSNVSVGYRALYLNSVGNNNISVGANTLSNSSDGSDNIAIGYQALSLSESGHTNIAIGTNALEKNISTFNSIAIGANALGGDVRYENGISERNIAIGVDSFLATQDYSIDNIVIGYQALNSFTITGEAKNNVIIGNEAVSSVTGIENCTFLGYNTQATLSSGIFTNSTVIGANASTTLSNSFILGYGCNVGIGTSTPNYTLYVGNTPSPLLSAPTNPVPASTIFLEETANIPPFTAGGGILYVDGNDLYFDSTGTPVNLTNGGGGGGPYGPGDPLYLFAQDINNIGISNQNINNLPSGSNNNLIFGSGALQNGANTNSLSNNIAFGTSTLSGLLAGSDNIAIGYEAAVGGGSGTNSANICIGSGAGNTIDQTDGNVFIGYQAGESTSFSNQNVFIGYQAGNTANHLTYAIGIGSNALNVCQENGHLAIGNQAGAAFGSTNGYYYNVFLGCQSGEATTNSASSVLIGGLAGSVMTAGNNNTFIGYSAGQLYETYSNAVLIGSGADAVIAFGGDPATDPSLTTGVIAIGYKTTAGTNSVALGTSASATANNAVAVGSSASSADNGIAIGYDAVAATNTIAIGVNSFSGAANSIAIGSATNSAAASTDGICIGNSGVIKGANSIGIGPGVTVDGANSIALGSGALAQGANSVAIGASANATGDNSIVLGTTGTNVGIGTSTPNYTLDIVTTTGMSFQGVALPNTSFASSPAITGQAYVEVPAGNNITYNFIGIPIGDFVGQNYIVNINMQITAIETSDGSAFGGIVNAGLFYNNVQGPTYWQNGSTAELFSSKDQWNSAITTSIEGDTFFINVANTKSSTTQWFATYTYFVFVANEG